MSKESPAKNRIPAFLDKWFAPAVLAGAFLWACTTVGLQDWLRNGRYRAEDARIRATGAEPVTLSIGHWQLEPGVRDGFNEMAAEYRKLHPNVRIVQQAIPESVYGQWSSTQFMGGTAPDLIEMGNGLPPAIVVSYYNRYCIRLTDVVNRPNPYNADNEFRLTPLRQTYKDGMLTAYNAELQDFVSIPLTQFAQRLFYNKDLYQKLTGKEKPSGNFREFMEDCRKIASQKAPDGSFYTPIVGSRYHTRYWDTAVLDLATWRLYEQADFNRDGYVGSDELFTAVQCGLVDFTRHPGIRARFELTRQITSQMQAGFTGLLRDDGVMKMAKRQAVFIPSGTWDVGSLITQAEGQFAVGIIDFPVPAPDDPEYGYWIPAPRFEKPDVGFSFAVTKFCKHPDVAVDFLLFLASKKGNETLNRRIGWIPVIKNTDMNPLLTSFKPTTEGISAGNFNYNLGGQTTVYWSQMYGLYQVNQIGLDDLLRKLDEFYRTRGLEDFEEQQKDWRRAAPNKERNAAGTRAAFAAATPPDPADTARLWEKYRGQTFSGLMEELNKRRLALMVKTGTAGRVIPPYEYTPAALENIRRQALAHAGSAAP